MDLDEALARASIKKTIMKYNISGDSGDAAGYASCFAEDAVLDVMGASQIETRAKIYDYIAAVKSTNYSGANRPTYLHHNLTTHSIEMIGPDTARGRCYFTVYTDCGPDHHGVYTDKYVKVGDEWLFSRRKITVDWFSPDSFAGRAAAAAGLK